ncbi:MAG TPA: hypothetical protein VN937_08795 [Blastocatellia bacterium]|nr:hypothetical protein [Blastocatellia bacterium]
MRSRLVCGARLVIVLLLFHEILVNDISAQDSTGQLEQLRNKYPWGSIYLTYIPISDLTTILSNSSQFPEVSKKESEEVVRILQKFLSTHQRPRQSEAIAFMEIDLNRIEAGFKWATDKDGVISKIPWDQKQVARVADLCDRFLNGNLVVRQITSQSTPPKVIQITHEDIKPGRETEHERLEAAYVAAFRRAEWPVHHLGMTSVSGSSSAWFLSSYASFEDFEAVQQKLSKDPQMLREFDRLSALDAEFRTAQRDIVAEYREDLSNEPMINISLQRYMTIKTVRVRPGHEADFEEVRRIVKSGYRKANVDEHSIVYHVVAGEMDGTYLIFYPMKSLAEAYAGRDIYGTSIQYAFDEQVTKRVRELASAAILSTETGVFAFNPTLSYVSHEFAAGDPMFWTPKPMTTKKRTAAKP